MSTSPPYENPGYAPAAPSTHTAVVQMTVSNKTNVHISLEPLLAFRVEGAGQIIHTLVLSPTVIYSTAVFLVVFLCSPYPEAFLMSQDHPD